MSEGGPEPDIEAARLNVLEVAINRRSEQSRCRAGHRIVIRNHPKMWRQQSFARRDACARLASPRPPPPIVMTALGSKTDSRLPGRSWMHSSILSRTPCHPITLTEVRFSIVRDQENEPHT